MLYKNARNKVISEMRKSKNTYESDLASMIKIDPKLFWSYVRSKLKTKTSLSQLKLPCGTLTNDNNQKAALLNVCFASVFETEGEEPIPDFPDRDFNKAITTVDISENVILKAISKLKPSKSQGPDNFSIYYFIIPNPLPVLLGCLHAHGVLVRKIRIKRLR